MLYITHDLASAAYIADCVAVMYLSTIVEKGSARDVLSKPQHPYTKSLMSVIPSPNPIDLPSGCRIPPRCPEAMVRCSQEVPKNGIVSEDQQAACFLLE
ncbi:MAG: hypothetical protein WBB65_09750 [Anaerolineales bacterium]